MVRGVARDKEVTALFLLLLLAISCAGLETSGLSVFYNTENRGYL